MRRIVGRATGGCFAARGTVAWFMGEIVNVAGGLVAWGCGSWGEG